MYYFICIDKRKVYVKTYYQQNKERYKQRYTGQKLKLKENEASVDSNEHNIPVSEMGKLEFQQFYLFT